MIVNQPKPNLEMSDDMDSTAFSIQDLGMVFDILRSKLYSNPILAICREIACNARDAHREIGVQEKPIQITLPNTLEAFYKIKDVGPGISEKRVADVFVKYAASTKRDSNIQTGFFGIGSKVPFSYASEFTVETIVDNIKYNYVCTIDETKVGKLLLMSKESSDQPNGTEIIIPVKPQDFRFFNEYTEFVTRHWDVKPTIKGGTITYKTINPTLKGIDWAVTNSTDYYAKRDVKLIVDGIEYPVDLTQLKGYASTKVLDAIHGIIYLYFGVGELSLAANRESVHLDKPTQEKIAEKLSSIGKHLTDEVIAKIDAMPNLWDAHIYASTELRQTFSDLKFLGQLKYKGTDLSYSGYIQTNLNIYEFYKGRYSKSNKDENKISRSFIKEIRFQPDSKIYLNDLNIKDPTSKDVVQAFTDNEKLKSVLVVSLPDGKTWDEVNKAYHLDQMNPGKLSDITKESKTRKTSGVRLLVFQFDTTLSSFKQVAYEKMEEDTNTKVLCFLEKDIYNSSRKVILDSKKTLTNDTINSVLSSAKNTSIYGVDNTIPKEKIDENFEGFTKIDQFIEEKVLNNKNISYEEIRYAEINKYNSFLKNNDISFSEKIIKKIKDPNSFYLKALKLQKSISDTLTKNLGMLRIYESIKGSISDKAMKAWEEANKDKSIAIMKKQMEETYPLLNYVDYYYRETMVDPLIHYINLVDLELKGKDKDGK